MSLILGLETSCDETAAAVVADGLVILSNAVSSQHELHERYGGVVPEIASRAHVERLWPIVNAALDEAGVAARDLDAVAVGNRPGLVGSLIVGTSAAKALAWSLSKPLIGIDHVRAHLYAAALRDNAGDRAAGSAPRYPALGLVVSGGHTALYDIQGPLDMTRLGGTIDDAVGEAYDKAAVILNAGYPGGQMLDRLAQTGDGSGHALPRSMLGRESLDFSFSGLKTALLYAVRGRPTRASRGKKAEFERSIDDLSDRQRADLAAAFQEAVVETLIKKLARAVAQLDADGRRPISVIVGGGVSANSLLRRRVTELGAAEGLAVHLPPLELCVDNAAMIAGLAHARFAAGERDGLSLPVVATTAM